MKNKLFIWVLLFVVFNTYSQVGIGTTNPHSSSILDLAATDKGLLFPRVALTATATAAPLGAHVAGMTVYNTATAGDVTPGLYTNNGTVWVSVNDVTNILTTETLSHKINSVQVYAIKGSFTLGASANNITLTMPAGLTKVYKVSVYDAVTSNVISINSISNAGSLIFGSTNFAATIPAGTYSYILEYFK